MNAHLCRKEGYRPSPPHIWMVASSSQSFLILFTTDRGRFRLSWTLFFIDRGWTLLSALAVPVGLSEGILLSLLSESCSVAWSLLSPFVPSFPSTLFAAELDSLARFDRFWKYPFSFDSDLFGWELAGCSDSVLLVAVNGTFSVAELSWERLATLPVSVWTYPWLFIVAFVSVIRNMYMLLVASLHLSDHLEHHYSEKKDLIRHSKWCIWTIRYIYIYIGETLKKPWIKYHLQ